MVIIILTIMTDDGDNLFHKIRRTARYSDNHVLTVESRVHWLIVHLKNGSLQRGAAIFCLSPASPRRFLNNLIL